MAPGEHKELPSEGTATNHSSGVALGPSHRGGANAASPTRLPCTGGAKQHNGGAGGHDGPVDIYGNTLPTINHITHAPALGATEESHTVLHTRAAAWYASIIPTPDEHTMRIKVVAELRAVVTAEWEGQAQLRVFGSSATGLLLKGGWISASRFPAACLDVGGDGYSGWDLRVE